MQLFVGLPHAASLTVEVADGPACSVEAFRDIVHQRTGVDPCDQRLSFGGKDLRSHLCLGDHGVQEGSTVFLLGRLPGGALLGKDMKGRGKKNDDDRLNRAREQGERELKYLAARAELKERLQREEANSRINRLKIQNQWRKIMRSAKVDQLQRSIEILSQNHERDVDRKDAIIQMLDRDLEEAEDQFQMSLRCHIENVDRLVDLHDSSLLALEQEFEKDLQTVEQEFNAERDAIETHHARSVEELTAIIMAVDQDEADKESDTKQEHDQGREEIKNKHLEEINMLRIQLDSQIEDLEQKFENAHLNYLQTTDQRTSDFKYFTKKDQELSKDIEIKIRKIERLQASLNHWRTKYNQNVKECQTRNALMMEEKNKIQSHFQLLKQRMNKFRSIQAARLSELTKNTTKARNTLTEQAELAERILGLAELARKMETEREKVTPHHEPLGAQEGAQEAAEETDMVKSMKKETFETLLDDRDAPLPSPYQSSVCEDAGGPVRRFNQLDRFWKKFNKVLLDKLAIENERNRLRDENEALQRFLKQYIDGVSVNDSVLNTAGNPLLVINGQVNLNRPLPVRLDKEALTVVDGNHMVATNRVNNPRPL